jgi:chlorophyllide a oxygenase
MQVLGEDLVLVTGQQDRMLRGSDVWANPVAYDKLGVRYRRWRNSVASGSRSECEAAEGELRPMSAGELFSIPDDDCEAGDACDMDDLEF